MKFSICNKIHLLCNYGYQKCSHKVSLCSLFLSLRRCKYFVGIFFFCHVIFIFKYRNSRVSRISEFHQIIYRNGSKINLKKLFCKLYCYTFNTFSLSGSTTVYRQLIRRKDEKIVNEKVKTEKNHAIKWIMSAILVKILPFLEHKKTVY